MSLKNNTFYVLSENYKRDLDDAKQPSRKCVMCGPVDDDVEIVYDTRVDPVLGVQLGYNGWCRECIKINDMFDKWQWG
jgi:hypothetical protein